MMADFYSGYNDAGARGERTTLANLQALTGVQALIGSQDAQAKARRAAELETQFRNEIQGATTPEAKLAVAQKYMGAESLGKSIQTSQDKGVHEASTREMARGRLAQALTLADIAHQDRMRNATTAEARAAETARHNFQIEAIQRDALANTGARLAYETGATPANSAATLAASQPPADNSGPATFSFKTPSGAMLQGEAPSGTAAEDIGLAALGRKRVGAPMPVAAPVAAPGAAQPTAPDAWSPPAAAPAVAAPAAPTAPVPLTRAQGGLAPDNPAADLRAQGQAAFEAAKAPVAPVPVVAQMPKFSGSPKEVAHQENMWRQSQSKSAGTAQLSPEALKIAGWEKLAFGTDPKGMGTASAQQRAQVADERARIGKSLGLSDQEMAMMPYDASVKKKAIGNMINWGAGVGKAQEQLEKSIDLAMEYVDKLGPGRVQMLNKAILAGEKQFNDPDANAYALAVNTVRTEYGRLMTGPTSNAMLPVEAIKKGDQLISNGFDKKSWQEIKSFIGKEAKITKESVDNQVNGLRNSLLPKGAAPETGPAERRAEPRATEKRVVVTY